MMTFLTLKMVCLQNRNDIVRVEMIRHVLGHDVVVVFNDESSIYLRVTDGPTAQTILKDLLTYVPTS